MCIGGNERVDLALQSLNCTIHYSLLNTRSLCRGKQTFRADVGSWIWVLGSGFWGHLQPGVSLQITCCIDRIGYSYKHLKTYCNTSWENQLEMKSSCQGWMPCCSSHVTMPCYVVVYRIASKLARHDGCWSCLDSDIHLLRTNHKCWGCIWAVQFCSYKPGCCCC